MPPDQSSLFIVHLEDTDQPIDAALAQSLVTAQSPLAELPTLTNVVLGDPYLAEQLAALRHGFELRPPAAQGLASRVRARLAWWLFGPEIQQLNQTNATLLRIIDSLIVLADHERAERRSITQRVPGSEASPRGYPAVKHHPEGTRQ